MLFESLKSFSLAASALFGICNGLLMINSRNEQGVCNDWLH